MKKLTVYIVLSLLFLVLFQFCEDENPSTPEENQIKNSESITIGTEGGEFESENISIKIPSGALSEETNIKISELNGEDPFNGQSSTSVSQIEGLPDNFSKPIQIKIKLNNNDSGLKNIAVGQEHFVKSIGEHRISYKFYDATESDGYLTFNLPANQSGASFSKSSSPDFSRAIKLFLCGVFTSPRLLSSQGHFSIKAIKSTATDAQVNALAEALENAYSTLENIGYKYQNRTKWPIEVFCLSMEDGLYGYHQNSVSGYNEDYLVFNSSTLTDNGLLRITSGHEFHHFVQGLYDGRTAYKRANEASINYWLYEATAVWSEELFTSESNYIPGIIEENAAIFTPFDGIHRDIEEIIEHKSSIDNKNATTMVESHGYGMASFIKYLVKNYGGNNVVSELMSKSYSGYHPIESLKEITGNLPNCYTSFIEQHMFGEIYKVPFHELANLNTITWQIKGPEDTLKVYNQELQNLSAKLYKISFKYPAIDSTAKLLFSLTGSDHKMILLKHKRTSSTTEDLVKLAEGKDNLIISDLKDIIKNKYDVYLALINTKIENPYTKRSNFTLEIKLKQASQFNEHQLDYSVMSKIKIEEGDETRYIENLVHSNKDNVFSGSFSNNTFISSWNETSSDGFNTQGTINVRFNNDLTKVEEYRLDETFGNSSDLSGNSGFTFINIPLVSSTEEENIYEILGTGANSHITRYIHINNSSSQKLTLMSNLANKDNKIRLIFKKEKSQMLGKKNKIFSTMAN